MPGFNANHRAVEKQQRCLAHRLRSIREDAERADRLLRALREEAAAASGVGGCVDVHAFANLRCGAWYLPACSALRGGAGLADALLPEAFRGCEADAGASPVARVSVGGARGAAYWKSSDGHYGQWAFSVTRLNVHVLQEAGALVEVASSPPAPTAPSGGDARRSIICVVDATQHGKRFPDALAKTVPLWCQVLNAAIGTIDGAHAGGFTADEAFPVSAGIVSAAEAAAMQELVPAFAEDFKRANAVLVPLSRFRLRRPLRCVWVAASDDDAEARIREAARHITGGDATAQYLLLLSASGDGETPRPRRGWHYVPGAADDQQSWARGLTCDLFWAHAAALTDTTATNDEVERRADALVAAAVAKQRVEADEDDANDNIKNSNAAQRFAIGSGFIFLATPRRRCGSQQAAPGECTEMVITISIGSGRDGGDPASVTASDPEPAATEGAPGPAADVLLRLRKGSKHDIERSLHRVLAAVNAQLHRRLQCGRGAVVIECEQLEVAAAFACAALAFFTADVNTGIETSSGLHPAMRPYDDDDAEPHGRGGDGDGPSEGEGLTALGRALVARAITKSMIQRAHQIVANSTGVHPRRADIKQVCRYFMTCDIFGKNSY